MPLRDFIAHRYGLPPRRLRVSLCRLGGGLESEATRARLTSDVGSVPRRLIVKTVQGRCRRESTMYELLRVNAQAPPTPASFGVHANGDTEHLYLEDVPNPSVA